MGSFKGKRILITGSANGIGRCLAGLFAEQKSTLILVDLDEAGLEKAKNELEQITKVYIFRLDISDREKVRETAETVLETTGLPDILINNAGIAHLGEMVETSIEEWERLMNVNFWGPLYFIDAFLPYMVCEKKGHVVNVSSGQAFFRLPTWGPYSVSKLGFGAYSELLGLEAKKLGINVTTVYPYIVNTEGFHGGLDYETFGAKISNKLLPLYSQSPERVAKIIFRAVKKKKTVEMISVLNGIGYYSRLLPPVSNLISRMAFRFLGKSPEKIRCGFSVPEEAHSLK